MWTGFFYFISQAAQACAEYHQYLGLPAAQQFPYAIRALSVLFKGIHMLFLPYVIFEVCF